MLLLGKCFKEVLIFYFMTIYTEGILFYLFLVDSLVYFVYAFFLDKKEHWLSSYFKVNKFYSIFYLFIMVWLGFALYRMQIITFWR
jgi:hypothetical protein